ncbi:colicin V production protein [Variibacter gotjawalensis]|uniref:Colicin V production protein n=1 Tax=Variibacter gotjawalensis TaxID=1333996 RepID=A0A0S3PX99_9BRAD|nr:CvpA family protein [Variibacter gotjawalensis]NIK46383.1 membrane protein required for colicin V production [Variibacter gotjawalensis]RZS48293.1 membrane protein required for colicin V production [Variibacter gotjawalensis]BAT60553.1 colicin V production protein [Variibacter gotjawalensis]
MPLTLLDIILLAVMLISGILAMVRGFMREVLSIVSWVAAALLTLYAFPRLKPEAMKYVSNELVASGLVVGGVFIGSLLIVSLITIKISDMILDSRIGALDRTMGFLFGLARGLVIVVVAFLFFVWLVPERSQPEWVKNAKSRVVLENSGKALMSMLPDDPEGWYRKLKQKKDGEEAPADTPPADPARPRGANVTSPTVTGSVNRSAANDEQRGYAREDRQGMQQLLDATQKRR